MSHIAPYIEALMNAPVEGAALEVRINHLKTVNHYAKLVEEEIKRKCDHSDEELTMAPKHYLTWQIVVLLHLLVVLHRKPYNYDEAHKLAQQIQSCEGRLIQHLVKGHVSERDHQQAIRHTVFLLERYTCALGQRGPWLLPRALPKKPTEGVAADYSLDYPTVAVRAATLTGKNPQHRLDLMNKLGTGLDVEEAFDAPESRIQAAQKLFAEEMNQLEPRFPGPSFPWSSLDYDNEVAQAQATLDQIRHTGIALPLDLKNVVQAGRARGYSVHQIAQDIVVPKKVWPLEAGPVWTAFMAYLDHKAVALMTPAERTLVRSLAVRSALLNPTQQQHVALLDAKLRGKIPDQRVLGLPYDPPTEQAVGAMIAGVSPPATAPSELQRFWAIRTRSADADIAAILAQFDFIHKQPPMKMHSCHRCHRKH